MRLGALENSGVCAVDVESTSGVLLLQSILKGVDVAVPETLASGPQKRGD